ncbi:MAG: GAF domain-containing sensor histidine kinase [Gammaproteobacteria bacterium]|nr:GAF domain-containing sensor histidine kinase [Gammaproteobacteria bacterium]MDH5801680.1 GAF domain-containing sensor histidine kinase [Gammaproteobacteria bacterium]
MVEQTDVIDFAENAQSASEKNRESGLENIPLVLCIGRQISQLSPITKIEQHHELLVVYAQDVESAQRILDRDTVDVIAINETGTDKNIECLQYLAGCCNIDQIPAIALVETLDEEKQTALFRGGFIDCFDAGTPKSIFRQKIIRLKTFRNSCISDNREITHLRSRTQKLHKILKDNNNYLEKLNASLKFEKLKRKELEQVHFIINRSLMTINAGNEALLSAKSEAELAQAMCDVLVTYKRYSRVWVGVIEQGDTKKLKVLGQAGLSDRSESVGLNCMDTPYGCSTINNALESSAPVVNGNIPNKASCLPCWEDAEVGGFNATVSLPLNVGDKVVGALNISANLGMSIEHDELELLRSVAADLAYGLDALRSRSERDYMFLEMKSINNELEKKIENRTKTLREANEKLKDLDKLKSLFIASMSHELRTPLNSIIGFTGIVLQGMSGELNEKQSDQLKRVYGSAKHLLELIVNVIDIAKIEGHRLDVFPSSFSLSSAIDEVKDEFTGLVNKKGLTLAVKGVTKIEMHTDRKRVTQCLRHLVSNAVKYTEAGGITIEVQESEEAVEVQIIDTGIGIENDQMKNCFQAFERLSSHLKVKAGGAGLGLYLTKKLVIDLLKGSIEVESVPGHGSTFRLLLPKVYFSKQ